MDSFVGSIRPFNLYLCLSKNLRDAFCGSCGLGPIPESRENVRVNISLSTPLLTGNGAPLRQSAKCYRMSWHIQLLVRPQLATPAVLNRADDGRTGRLASTNRIKTRCQVGNRAAVWSVRMPREDHEEGTDRYGNSNLEIYNFRQYW